jgi:SAM-dependent methyltransferase
MIEVVVIFLFLVLGRYLHSPSVSFWGFFLLLVFIAPGLYSLMTGAPFIASGKKRVDAILFLAKAKKDDHVVELGCGDARIIRRLWFTGVRDLTGYEFSMPTYLWARFLKWKNRSGEKIVFGDFWKVDYSKVDVLICFLMDGAMKRFEKEVWGTLKSGARLVSNEFELPGVKPDETRGRVHLYVKK